MKLPLNEINWYFINQLEILQPKKRSYIQYIPNTKLFLKPFLNFSGCRPNLHVLPSEPLWVRPRNRTPRPRSRMPKTEIPDDYTHDGRCDTPASVTREFQSSSHIAHSPGDARGSDHAVPAMAPPGLICRISPFAYNDYRPRNCSSPSL